jgi:DNA primase
MALGAFVPNGEESLFFCPKCDHHKRKLSVNIEKNVFKCWVCDYSGKSILGLMRKYAPSELYYQWKHLSNEIDISKYEDFFSDQRKGIAEHRVFLPKNFKSLSSSKSIGRAKPTKYLLNRGFTEEDILKWKIGFCDFGEYRDRVIIPSFDEHGELNYFVARSFKESSYAKYKNPPKTKNIIFNDLMVDWQQDIVLVEGAFDAIKGDNCIPILGSTLKEDSLLFKKLCQHNPRVYLALDSDAEKKAYKIADLLMKNDLQVYKINVLPYNDIGEMTKEEFQIRKQKATFLSERDYLLYKLNF